MPVLLYTCHMTEFNVIKYKIEEYFIFVSNHTIVQYIDGQIIFSVCNHQKNHKEIMFYEKSKNFIN